VIPSLSRKREQEGPDRRVAESGRKRAYLRRKGWGVWQVKEGEDPIDEGVDV